MSKIPMATSSASAAARPQANNGMYPTANSAAPMQGLNACFVVCAAGDAQRSVSSSNTGYTRAEQRQAKSRSRVVRLSTEEDCPAPCPLLTFEGVAWFR